MSFIPGRMPADSGDETTGKEAPSPVHSRRRSQPRRERPPSDTDVQYDEDSPGVTRPRTGSVARVIRVIAGAALTLALIVVAANTVSDINGHPDASAVQVIQLYAEGFFYGLVAVGIGIAVYIFTRGID